jgi:hypothetical protein
MYREQEIGVPFLNMGLWYLLDEKKQDVGAAPSNVPVFGFCVKIVFNYESGVYGLVTLLPKQRLFPYRTGF